MNVFEKAMTEHEGQDIPVRITMNSRRHGVNMNLFDMGFDSGEDIGVLTRLTPEEESMLGIDDGREDFDPEEDIDLITEGILVCHLDPEAGVYTVTLTYPESELTGMEGSQSSLLFRTDEPGLIHMIRTGVVSASLTFREHCRAICAYDTPYMPFQVCIHGLRVENALLTDGTLVLDYILEIRGAQAEHCRMEVRVQEEIEES